MSKISVYSIHRCHQMSQRRIPELFEDFRSELTYNPPPPQLKLLAEDLKNFGYDHYRIIPPSH